MRSTLLPRRRYMSPSRRTSTYIAGLTNFSSPSADREATRSLLSTSRKYFHPWSVSTSVVSS